MPNTDKDWEKWARCDPYFGVLADASFSKERISSNRDSFFATGEQFVRDITADSIGRIDQASPGRALDHGCGVGRLTIPLARIFREVVALDVAQDMLREAEANAATAGCRNIAFALADDRLTRAEGLFDFVVSHLVLQHIPVARGLIIFRSLLDRCAPGGAFHISVAIRNDTGPQRWLYWASANLPGVKMLQNLLKGERWNAPAMQMNDYPLGVLIAELAKRRVQRIAIAIDAYHDRFQTVSIAGSFPPA